MKVIIYNLNSCKRYIAKRESDCKDETDKSVFREAMRSKQIVIMGKVIGDPIATKGGA